MPVRGILARKLTFGSLRTQASRLSAIQGRLRPDPATRAVRFNTTVTWTHKLHAATHSVFSRPGLPIVGASINEVRVYSPRSTSRSRSRYLSTTGRGGLLRLSTDTERLQVVQSSWALWPGRPRCTHRPPSRCSVCMLGSVKFRFPSSLLRMSAQRRAFGHNGHDAQHARGVLRSYFGRKNRTCLNLNRLLECATLHLRIRESAAWMRIAELGILPCSSRAPPTKLSRRTSDAAIITSVMYIEFLSYGTPTELGIAGPS
jgi:hypothetical protein